MYSTKEQEIRQNCGITSDSQILLERVEIPTKPHTSSVRFPINSSRLCSSSNKPPPPLNRRKISRCCLACGLPVQKDKSNLNITTNKNTFCECTATAVTYECSQCHHFKTKWKKALARHVKNIHEKEQRYKFKCPRCPKNFLNHQNVRAHYVTHTPKKSHNCHFCLRPCATNSGKQRHENICKKRPDGDQIKAYICEYCEHRFSQNKDKIIHERRCKKRPDGLVIKPFICQFCQCPFPSKNSKLVHEKVCQKRPDGLKIKPYKCQFCQNGFPSNYHKKEHENSCKKRGDNFIIKPHNCQTCGKAFSYKISKNRHERKCSVRLVLHINIF